LSFRLVNNVAPAWSPDSKQIIFLSDRHSKWEFYAVNVDGTNIKQVLQSVTNQLTIQYYFSNERVIDWIK
jgi:Tol biopolymer transport system component